MQKTCNVVLRRVWRRPAQQTGTVQVEYQTPSSHVAERCITCTVTAFRLGRGFFFLLFFKVKMSVVLV